MQLPEYLVYLDKQKKPYLMQKVKDGQLVNTAW